MRYHGNYCGPNWSAGQHQSSVVSDVTAVDEFDATCKAHDAIYATNGDLDLADQQFYKENIGKGMKRSVAAVAVKLQQIALRHSRDKISNSNFSTMTKNLRGSKTAPKQNTTTKQSTKQVDLATVPAAYGYMLRMQPPKVVRKGNTATVAGSDFAGVLKIANTTNYEPSASVFVNPIYFQSSMLGSLSRTYEKFRVKRSALQYIPSVPTSTPGQLVMCSTATVKEPFIAGTSSTFLSRALSQYNAVATPLWREAIIEHPASSEWYTVDALIDGDLDDAIAHEYHCYTLGANAQDAGILILHYEFEFKDPLYTYHPTLIPVPHGNGSFFVATDDSAVNATNDIIRLQNFTPGVAVSAGSVFRLVFQAGLSTPPVGPAAWGTVADAVVTSPVTVTTVTQVSLGITMVTGTTLYGLWDAFAMTLFTSYEEAANGGVDGALKYRVATTAVGTWSFIAHLVRIAGQQQITTQ